MDSQKLFLQYFLLLILLAFSSSKDTLTINQTIQDGNFMISRENNFALGFFSPRSSKFRYLGIWYHKVREQNVVWVANRNNPINDSSGVLSIDQYGNLILYSNHNQQVPVWSANVSVEDTGTCVAQLLDTGNLILVQDSSKGVVWQSFDHPTDTVLPGMKLGLDRRTGMNRFLISWRSANDPGVGNFSLQINPKGSPQVFLYWDIKCIWRGIAWPLKSYADETNVSFVNNQDEIYMSYVLSDASVFQRVILDYSGLVKKQTWHEKDGKWKEFWSVTMSFCDPYAHCGSYGICDPNYVSRRFECDCLPGYEPKSARDWHILKDASSGCVRKRLESISVCGHGEGFVKVTHVKVPDTSTAIWVSMNMSPRDCEKDCRRNCSCSAYASIDIAGKGTGCLTWYGKLMDTVHNIEEGYDIYVRVDAVEIDEIAQNSNGFFKRKDMLAVLVVSVVSAWLIIILFVCMWLKKKKKKRVRNKWSKRWLDTIGNTYYKQTWEENEVEGDMSHPKIAFFSLSTILSATSNFSPANKLGEGGFGMVYKGQEPMLVYEYMPNKSLDSFIFNETRRSTLNWRKRFDIIVGIARGILYIHQDSRLRIIHRDLKTSNILLDEEMNPKISDFGLARILKRDQSQEKTNKIVGTFGYMSPEYVVFGKFSTKSDVFSFGIILLEIITGKKSNSFCQEDSYPSMIGKMWHLWREERALEMVDSSLQESCSVHKVLRCIQIGLLCVQEDALERPDMSTVVVMLNSEDSLPTPKQPPFIFKRSSNSSSSLVIKEKGFYSVDEETITELVCR
ncbi:G-type lectin S-receptor-like serine/threonine-protein kinase RKS1 isoform X2 [Manihot esculenta]|uniref:G-type lectin S-receptor-like serine/threonine-protein kinase RKS1 isoform X2 n=1 Tax=Manihot esculenta TaxID=3983 RepID=UPI000B5D1B9F|nr:G-type lectin S-receptor-like serine/threonine-protein kinase RKS1 isoform X2 [Manihot esculenta]